MLDKYLNVLIYLEEFMSSKLRQIAIDEGNYQALKEFGLAGDSFNDVISKILKKLKNETEVMQS